MAIEISISEWSPSGVLIHKEHPYLTLVSEDLQQKSGSEGAASATTDKNGNISQKYDCHERFDKRAKDCDMKDGIPTILVGPSADTLLPTPSSNMDSLHTRSTVAETPTYPDLCRDDLTKLKLLASRLKLQPSHVSRTDRAGSRTEDEAAPEAEGLENANGNTLPGALDGQWVSRTQKIQDQLDYIKDELRGMREQDTALARQLMALHNDIQQTRLQHSSWAVEDMVDEAQCSLAKRSELKHVWDEPQCTSRTPLLTVGVTKMNLTERRFSVF